MNPKFQEKVYSPSDIRRIKKEIEKFPPNTPIAKMGKELSGILKQRWEILKRWVLIAVSFSDETIDMLEAGKINRNRLNTIAKCDYPNPAYKDYVARQAIERNLSAKELLQIYQFVRDGRHPNEAIEIVRGVRPERPITKNDALSLDRLIREWEKDGFAWRQRSELIRQQGKIQILQNGQLSTRLAYTLAAMKVAAGDMSRYIDEIWKEVPQEVQRAVEAEFRGPEAQPEEPAAPIVQALPEVTVVEPEPDPAPEPQVEPEPMPGT